MQLFECPIAMHEMEEINQRKHGKKLLNQSTPQHDGAFAGRKEERGEKKKKILE